MMAAYRLMTGKMTSSHNCSLVIPGARLNVNISWWTLPPTEPQQIFIQYKTNSQLGQALRVWVAPRFRPPVLPSGDR